MMSIKGITRCIMTFSKMSYYTHGNFFKNISIIRFQKFSTFVEFDYKDASSHCPINPVLAIIHKNVENQVW